MISQNHVKIYMHWLEGLVNEIGSDCTVQEELKSIGGRLCEILIPIKYEYYIGDEEDGVAICTLSSIDLLEAISKDRSIMSRILIVGRLLSENKGIDRLIIFTLSHPNLHHIVVCGNDAKGHNAGQALLSLHRNGVNTNDGRINGATDAYRFLTSSQADIESFRTQTNIYDLIGIKDIDVIKAQLRLFCQ
jgi:tetrahydromethanopterin S-methyltransferase subunit A